MMVTPSRNLASPPWLATLCPAPADPSSSLGSPSLALGDPVSSLALLFLAQNMQNFTEHPIPQIRLIHLSSSPAPNNLGNHLARKTRECSMLGYLNGRCSVSAAQVRNLLGTGRVLVSSRRVSLTKAAALTTRHGPGNARADVVSKHTHSSCWL